MLQTAKCVLRFSSQEIIKITPSHFSCRPLLVPIKITPFLFLLSHYLFSYTPHTLIQSTNSKNKTQQWKKMYPKVKVRPEQDEDDCGSVLFLESFSSQEDETQSDSNSPPIIARVTKANSISASKVMNNQKKNGEERKLSGRAASVLRPRVVLSSPDNDGMIGKRNRLKDGGSVFSPTRLQYHDVQQMPVCNKTNKCSFKKKNSSESKIRKHKSPLVRKVNEDKNN